MQLRELEVGDNNITGTLPSSWSTLTQASTISIACVLAIIHVKHLITLQSPKCIAVTGSGIQFMLSTSCHLRVDVCVCLCLCGDCNQPRDTWCLSHCFPKRFSANSRIYVTLQLESCHLYINQLTGSLPSSWSSMVQVCNSGHLCQCSKLKRVQSCPNLQDSDP